MKQASEIAPAEGKLGILLVGLGAVSTTTIAGVVAIRKGLAQPIGSLTQMGTIRLGKRTENRSPKINEFVPLAKLEDVVFGGWDIFEEDCYAAACTAGVLERSLLDQIRTELEAIKPMPAVFDQRYVKRLSGPNVKKGKNKKDLADQLIADIRDFKKKHNCSRLVMVWCGSTEVYMKEGPVHQSLAAFEKGLELSDEAIPSSMVYAYAALREGLPFANAAPNLTADVPAMLELAAQTGAPLAGNDMKTGQTLIKTIIAPGLKARMIGVRGWYSTNILGNRDGEVLDDPESFKTKEESKKSALDYIFQPHLYPDLYKDLSHVVRINYYPPRGDNKEGWDNIDIFGWLGYPMQIKVNFLCRDSILAAPLVLDLALFLDLAQRAGIGWIGKNTCLIHPRNGSYFLLSEILLDLELEPDAPFISDHCGTCTRCIEACPTDCILPDRTIDARRCISYLTIELKDAIPLELREKIGDWVFGCDVCQQVCPWNRFAVEADAAFDAKTPPQTLTEELSLTPQAFNQRFKRSPVKRAKRRGYLRNVAVALGNTGDTHALPVLQNALNHEEPMIREHAQWAIDQIKRKANL